MKLTHIFFMLLMAVATILIVACPPEPTKEHPPTTKPELVLLIKADLWGRGREAISYGVQT